MDEIQRFSELKEKIKKLSESKIRLEEKYKNERERLEVLIKEISSKGYDPTKLAEIKVAKEAELKQCLDDLEKSVKETADKLTLIEEPTNV